MNTYLATQKALDRLARDGFEKLNDSDQILAAVWTYQAGVANRGFDGYFSSAGGDLAYFVPTAFKAIGGVGVTEIATEANNVFGADGPPKDRKERQARMRSFDGESWKKLTALEGRFYESREDVDELLELYLDKKH